MRIREIFIFKISWFFWLQIKRNPNFMYFEARRIFVLFTIISYKLHPIEFCPLSKHVNVPSLKGFGLIEQRSGETEMSLAHWSVFGLWGFFPVLEHCLTVSFDLLLEFQMPFSFFQLGTLELGNRFLMLATTAQLQQRQCDLPTNSWIIFIHPDLIITDFASAPFREVEA